MLCAARGYIDGQDGTEVAVSCDPAKAVFTVQITQVQPLWFSQLYLSHLPTVSGLAVAQLAGKESDLCILALDGTQLIARTISFTGNSDFQTVCTGTGVSPVSVLTPKLIQ